MSDEVFIKVKDRPELVRDKRSNAILNVDTDALNKYKEERDKILNMRRGVEEHDQMKNDISDIKQMLLKIMEKK
jgi:hypothetical protein